MNDLNFLKVYADSIEDQGKDTFLLRDMVDDFDVCLFYDNDSFYFSVGPEFDRDNSTSDYSSHEYTNDFTIFVNEKTMRIDLRDQHDTCEEGNTYDGDGFEP